MSSSGGLKGKPDRSDIAPYAQAVGASPYVYHNLNQYEHHVLLAGGSGLSIRWSRNGAAWFAIGGTTVMQLLSIGDWIEITYLTVPTMTIIPR